MGSDCHVTVATEKQHPIAQTWTCRYLAVTAAAAAALVGSPGTGKRAGPGEACRIQCRALYVSVKRGVRRQHTSPRRLRFEIHFTRRHDE